MSDFSYDKNKIDAFLNSSTISITLCLWSQNGRRCSVEELVMQVTLSAKKKRDGAIVHSQKMWYVVQVYGDQQMEIF